MGLERRRVTYEGQVQGIGFRMTVRRLATAYPVAGYVRNLDDGRVELIAEGETSDVASFLGAIRREFADNIRDVAEETMPSGDRPFGGFGILH